MTGKSKKEERKRTMLYLSRDLVEKAKKEGLNLSRTAEAAIKSKVSPYLSKGGRMTLTFEDYKNSLMERNDYFSLPFKVDKLKLENIGPFEEVEVDLGDFNIILGPNGAGKSILMKSILVALGRLDKKTKRLLRSGENNGKIELTLAQGREIPVELERSSSGKTTSVNRENKCVLIDNPFSPLDKSKREKVWGWISDLNCQVILTTPRRSDLNFPVEEIKIISLVRKEGKTVVEVRDRQEDKEIRRKIKEIEDEIEMLEEDIEAYTYKISSLKEELSEKKKILEQIEKYKEHLEEVKMDRRRLKKKLKEKKNRLGQLMEGVNEDGK